MKRDMDLIRSILVLTEEQPAGGLVRDFSSLGADHQTVVEHVRLARDGGLLEAKILDSLSGRGSAIVIRLTPAGHDFLAQARQPVLWNKAKETARKAGVGITVEVLKTLLSHLAIAAVTKAISA